MNTADATYIKALNKRILIEKIIENQSISRIELSRITGLNRSTVSAQINQMMEEELVLERSPDVSRGGRKAILLQMNENAGFTIGVDIDYPSTQVQVTNLLGKPIRTYHIEMKEKGSGENIEHIIKSLQTISKECKIMDSPKGLVGIGVGIHGIVHNSNDVVYTPKLDWIDVELKDEMQKHFNVPIFIDNNANLTVYAEQVFNHPLPDLFTVTMYSGIGLGILENNRIYRGYQGFAGEIGHMIVEKGGLPCPCGNQGCWELYASERALIRALNDKGVPIDCLTTIDDSVWQDHPELLTRFLDYLAIGLNNIINIFNPQITILNSEFLLHHQELLEHLKQRLTSKINNYDAILTSTLGKDACSLGGAMLALKNYYQVETLNLKAYNYF
ncbi:ROK family transcriptional regulator [Bacillus sp. SB49]|uniref:ROK family transcriptional regulator n=1 Tax=Bacillus sp. SB49 TaxID=1071080 RepID=UPI0004001D2C|nr:ROK family transcriptional regulator [Bacillus sp. SB49]QHT47833.1 ROK family transcriptional regulator [Bacillus sp. SB49]